MSHSPFGPSQYTRRIACPGSLRLERHVGIDDSSDEAQTGTILHEILSGIPESEQIELQKSLADWDLEALNRAFEFKRSLMEQYGDGFQILKEHFLDLSFIHPEIGKGTLDLGIVKAYDIAVISDYKFFFQKGLAEAQYNDQLRLYAIGLWREFELKSVRGILYMPHVNAISEYEWNSEALEYMENSYRLKTIQALDNPFHFQLGDHCRYCKAKPLCPAQIDNALSADTSQPLDLPGPLIADFLDKGELAKKWFSDLSQYAYQLLLGGRAIPGYGLFEGRKTRKWFTEDEKELEVKLVDMAKKIGKKAEDFWTEPEIKSPAQLENTWGKAKKVKEELDKLIETKAGALVMRKVMDSEGSKANADNADRELLGSSERPLDTRNG